MQQLRSAKNGVSLVLPDNQSFFFFFCTNWIAFLFSREDCSFYGPLSHRRLCKHVGLMTKISLVDLHWWIIYLFMSESTGTTVFPVQESTIVCASGAPHFNIYVS